MIYQISVPPYAQQKSIIKANYDRFPEYPLLIIGKESYLQGVIENSDEGHSETGRMIHNLQIGSYCSIALDIYFLIGRNKNYSRVSTSVARVLHTANNIYAAHHEKGSVIIKNDVWIGRKVSVMSGVTIHNGAVIAACSHVVKDVPPYAIVGGNPAKVIGYRFSEEIIEQLEKIQWWNWSDEKIEQNAKYFNDDVDGFCERFYKESCEEIEEVHKNAIEHGKDTYFMLVDYGDNYSVLEEVLNEFIKKWCQCEDKKLELFFEEQNTEEIKYMLELMKIIIGLYKDPNLKCEISLQCGNLQMVKYHLVYADHLIINRNENTILLMDYARKYGTNIEIISGVDVPIFT